MQLAGADDGDGDVRGDAHDDGPAGLVLEGLKLQKLKIL